MTDFVREVRLLSRIQLLRFAGINSLIHGHDRKQRLRALGVTAIWLLIGFIAALVHQPRLMVLDEPFVGLDPEAAFHLKRVMRELCDQGSAIFFSTHVLEVAQKLCDRVVMIRGGKLVAEGTMEEIAGDRTLEEVFMEEARND